METKTSEATQVSRLSKDLYCIEHERMESDLECSFPKGFTYSAPVTPDEDLEWAEAVAQNVSEEEREQAELEETGYWLGGEE